MNEKISSALDGLKGATENLHIKETIGRVGDKVKETVSEIDIKETLGDVSEKFKSGGLKGALGEIGDTVKEVAGKATDAVKNSLKENPGAAINNADGDKVTPGLVKERTAALNNNPRNNEM